MYNRLPIRAISLGVLGLSVWWLWSSSGRSNLVDIPASAANAQSKLVSAVEPIDMLEPNSALRVRPVAVLPGADTMAKFDQARAFAESGNLQAAIEAYQAIISVNPNVIEAYANLAAIYASQNQLSLAHQTLSNGLKANDKSSALFLNLQKVLGMLASKAYRDALGEEQQPDDALTLYAFDAIREIGPSRQQVSELQSQIASLQVEQATSLQALQKFEAERAERQSIELELAAANTTISELKNQYQLDLDSLQNKLEDQRILAQNLIASNEQKLKDQEAARIIANKEVADAKAEQERKDLELAEINAKLEQERRAKEELLAQQTELAEAQLLAEQKEQELLANAKVEQERKALELAEINAKLEQERKAKERLLAQQTELAKAQQLAEAQEQQRLAEAKVEQERKALELAEINAKLEQERKANEQLLAQQETVSAIEQQTEQLAQHAKDLVASWANAWSRQAVDDYVAHYTTNYSPPGSGLSHQQWLEQRQVRLTNKKFIDVEVSEFFVKPIAGGFSVEFSQHYKSDTLDDRIRKRLDFSTGQANWSDAKIVRERVVGR